MDPYILTLLIIGCGFLGAAWLPRVITQYPITFPIIYVAAGALIFSLPFEIFEKPDIAAYAFATEKLTEMTVIIALMGVGLRIHRPLSWRGWRTTWRLLGITMPLSIILVTLLAWQFMGLPFSTALLFGAILAPTDPVLAADIQAAPPGTNLDEITRVERNVTFALTSEAGLNDGLAFPFTNLALVLVTQTSNFTPWFTNWFLYDFVYKIFVGCLAGYLIGRTISYFVFRSPSGSHLAEAMEGSIALATTLIAYALTELVHGYGFIAVFIASLSIRHYRGEHKFHTALFRFTEDIERMLMAIVLILLGGVAASGILQHLTWQAAIVSFAVILVIRPITGLIGLLGLSAATPSRLMIAFFGIRGVGSIYYLAYAEHRAQFPDIDLVWSTTIFVILASIVIHGISATYAMSRLNKTTRRSLPQ